MKSYDTREPMLKAKEMGIEAYPREQHAKKQNLNQLLGKYDDGSRDVFFCLAVNMLDVIDLTAVLSVADQSTDALTRKEKPLLLKSS